MSDRLDKAKDALAAAKDEMSLSLQRGELIATAAAQAAIAGAEALEELTRLLRQNPTRRPTPKAVGR